MLMHPPCSVQPMAISTSATSASRALAGQWEAQWWAKVAKVVEADRPAHIIGDGPHCSTHETPFDQGG